MGRKKLTTDQVRIIKHLYGQGELSLRQLGSMFKVSATQIYRIVHKQQRDLIKDWVSDEDIRLRGKAVIEEAYANLPPVIQRSKQTKLSDKEVQTIRDRYETEPVSTRALASEYGVSARHICRIINKEQRKDV